MREVGTHKGGFPAESSVPIYEKPTIRYAVGTDEIGRALCEPRYERCSSSDVHRHEDRVRLLQHVDYLEYQKGLPFQADLFVPPADIQLSNRVGFTPPAF